MKKLKFNKFKLTYPNKTFEKLEIIYSNILKIVKFPIQIQLKLSNAKPCIIVFCMKNSFG